MGGSCLRGNQSGHCGHSHSRPFITPARRSGPWKAEWPPWLPFLGVPDGGRWVCVLLDLFPHGGQPPSPPLVTLPGHHYQSHLEEVAPFPVTEHLLTDEGCSELGPLYHPKSPQPCRPLVCPHAPGFLLPGDHCLRGLAVFSPLPGIVLPLAAFIQWQYLT